MLRAVGSMPQNAKFMFMPYEDGSCLVLHDSCRTLQESCRVPQEACLRMQNSCFMPYEA